MKKSWFLVPIMLLVGSGMVFAQQPKPSPKSAPPVTTAQAAAKVVDDRRVHLNGKIVSQQGKNVWIFQDASGKIPVVIGAKAVPSGRALSPGMPVEINGVVDRPAKGGVRVVAQSVRTVVGGHTGKGND